MKKLNTMLLGSMIILQATDGWAKEDDPCGHTLKMTKRIERGATNYSQAIETMTALNVIDRDARADYQAGRSITLLPGFKAEAGATFAAQVKSSSCEQFTALKAEESQLTLTAYPNPFVESTVIRYRLQQASPVYLSILDEQGKVVEVLVDGKSQEAGLHEFTYRNSSLSESLYLYSLRTKAGVITKRLLKGN